MSDRSIAFVNGNLVAADDAVVPATDAGFVQGITLAEQLRTFRGEPFLVEQHLDRLLQGAQDLGCDGSDEMRRELRLAIQQVATHNYTLVESGGDLGLTVVLTPGPYEAYPVAVDQGPRRIVHSYPLQFQRWQHLYQEGAKLVTVGVRQIPENCWSAQLKCRSRMHYYLAAKEARSKSPGAIALMLDQEERVCETPIANVIAVFEGEIISPPEDNCLAGVSQAYALKLAEEQNLKVHRRHLSVREILDSDEVMLSSTPFCLVPVQAIDGVALPQAHPVYDQLMKCWSENVHTPIMEQAMNRD